MLTLKSLKITLLLALCCLNNYYIVTSNHRIKYIHDDCTLLLQSEIFLIVTFSPILGKN